MRPVRQTVNQTGTGAPVPLDYIQSPFNVSFRAFLPSGATAVYGVQYTLDDLNDPNITNVDWIYDTNVGSGTAISATGNYMFPVRAVRINVASLSGGPIDFTVMQGLTP
jgi:hypothetical protein